MLQNYVAPPVYILRHIFFIKSVMFVYLVEFV